MASRYPVAFAGALETARRLAADLDPAQAPALLAGRADDALVMRSVLAGIAFAHDVVLGFALDATAPAARRYAGEIGELLAAAPMTVQ